MTPQEFKFALAVRLRILPYRMPLPLECRCRKFNSSTTEHFLEHVLKCDTSARYTHTHRHGDVMRALVGVARRYGITCSLEPNYFSYENGRRQRPDVVFHILPPLVTDVTIVFPTHEICQAAKTAEKAKTEKHGAAVKAMGNVFEPFVMEVFGHFGKHSILLLRRLARELPTYVQRDFFRSAICDVSTALAKAVAMSFMSARDQSNTFVNWGI